MSFVAIVLALASSGALALQNRTPGAAQTESSPATPSEITRLEAEIEALKRERAERRESDVGRIVDLMDVFLGLQGVVLGVVGALTGLGIWEWNRIRRVRREAEINVRNAQIALSESDLSSENAKRAVAAADASRRHAEKVLADAHEASRNIVALHAQLKTAFGRVEDQFVALRRAERDTVLGQPPPLPEPDEAVLFEDNDVLLVVCDRLGITSGGEPTSNHYLQFARYWRLVKDYPRAFARLARAGELAPQSFRPLLHRARTLALQAELDTADAGVRRKLLESAEKHARAAAALESADGWETVEQLAWILHSLERWDDAIASYRQAREQYERTNGRDASWRTITYNLCCALVQANNTNDALTELAAIIDEDENWKAVTVDSDFKPLWKIPEFKQLVEAAVGRRRTATD